MQKVILDKYESSLLLICKGWQLRKDIEEELKQEMEKPFEKSNSILNDSIEFAYEHATYAGIPLKYVQLKDIVVFRLLPLAEKLLEKNDFIKMMIYMCEWQNEKNTPLDTLFFVLRNTLSQLPIRDKITHIHTIEFDYSNIQGE